MMVSCEVHGETRALGQVFTCLDKYITLLYPNHQSTWVEYEGPLDVEDIKGGEEEQREEEKERERKKERKIQGVDTGCGGYIFYRFRVDVKPTEFIFKLMDYLKALPEDERKQEIHKRWLPMDYICPVVTERIAQCFNRMKEVEFKDVDDNATVAILTTINNSQMTKDEIIQTIAPLIPSKYKINLKSPTLVIYVNVFKSVCGMSVYKEYYERKKYNLISYVN
ncbi:hypothetical protein BDB01DRAFT_588911 [Pilobolus umbonatus]|nr:hypothetical protein BDB01DRAFT_588911 [Pilobolus umbonatus]